MSFLVPFLRHLPKNALKPMSTGQLFGTMAMVNKQLSCLIVGMGGIFILKKIAPKYRSSKVSRKSVWTNLTNAICSKWNGIQRGRWKYVQWQTLLFIITTHAVKYTVLFGAVLTNPKGSCHHYLLWGQNQSSSVCLSHLYRAYCQELQSILNPGRWV